MPVAAGLAEDELGRRILAHARADGPALVVEVEDRRHRAEVHVGVVVGVERAHVAPVESLLLVLVDEAVGHHLFLAQQVGQDVVAEVVLRVGIFGVGDQRLQKYFSVEDVNAHGGIDGVGVEGRAEGGGRRLFLEAENFAGVAHLDNAEARHLFRSDGQRGQRDLRLGLLVVLQHAAVVHLVDVVAGKDDHVLRLLAADGVDVLVDGVGGAHVPVGAGALHGRHELEELAEFLRHDAGPAFADVPVERERLVLGENEDPAQAGVDAVGERDIDDAVVAAEWNCRFGPIAG